MKKILMILYGWPPVGGVSSLRSLKFVKYLVRSGKWDITVLTPRNAPCQTHCDEEEGNIPGVKVVRTSYIDLSSKYKLLHPRILIPDEYIGWYRYAIDESTKLLKNDNYDLIYSCSPPETAHLVARRLKHETGLPWVADLRDLWSQDHYRERSFLKKFILMLIEKWTFSNTNAVVVASEPWTDMLKALHKKKGNDIHCITNGFDPEDFEGIPFRNEKKFVLSYMGKLHPTHQNPRIFFISLSELLKESKIDRKLLEIKFYIFGFKTPDINGLSKKYQLEDIVKVLPRVEYKKALEVMRGSTGLLLFAWRGHDSEAWYSQKVFDYLGARRPILLMNSKTGVVEKLINSTNSGYIARSKDEIKKLLVNLYEEFKTSGDVRYQGIEEEIQKHSRVNKTCQLSDILENVTSVL